MGVRTLSSLLLWQATNFLHRPQTFNIHLQQSPVKANTTIEQWSLRLQPYQPAIVYAPGPKNPAGYYSRYPSNKTQVTSLEEKVAEEYVNFLLHASPKAIDLEEVKRETLNYHTLQRVIESIRNNKWCKKESQSLRLDTKVFRSFPNVKDD